MTLEEVIAHHEWAAENCEGETSEEYAQMAAWLHELVELRADMEELRELLHWCGICSASRELADTSTH